MAYSITKTRKAKPRKAVTTAGLITFDQFYDIVEENVKADLLDGQILRDSPAIPGHGFTNMWVVTLIYNYNEIFKLGKIGGGTTTVRLAKYQSPEPDIFFIRNNRLGIVNYKFSVVGNSRKKYLSNH